MIRILRANSREVKSLLERKFSYGEAVEDAVKKIIAAVRERGESAVFEYTKMFDSAEITSENFRVTKDEMEEALNTVDDATVEAIREAADNIYKYHDKQKRVSWMEDDSRGNFLGILYRPIERAGIYVPGGTAAYPSSVLMNAIPAKVAGVNEIIMVTPPSPDGKVNPYTLVAAHVAGVTEIYKVGGAQAIAALAFGVGPIKSVDVITGPGNIYVTVAKKLVYGIVDIDMLAGPSEILIIADQRANPRYAAADILSQAEHDPNASAILITPEEDFAHRVKKEIESQLKSLTRLEIAKEALNKNSCAIITDDLSEAIELANFFAPEHLELLVEEPLRLLPGIKNAGAIFLGDWSPEPVGDYFAGPNHILPTGGTARFFSPVTVDTFLKKSSLIYYKKDNLLKDGSKIINLAETEGLDAHANSVRVRLEDENS